MDHGHVHHKYRHRHENGAEPAAGSSATAPVWGMQVDSVATPHSAEHEHASYCFCSAGCRSKFVADPARYLAGGKAPEGSGVTVYTCPMHQGIRGDGLGSCPICEMTLEPLTPTSGPIGNAEFKGMNRSFWIGLFPILRVFALEMEGYMTGLVDRLGLLTSNRIQLVLASPVVLWAGRPFFERGWRSLVSRRLNMFTFVALGTGAAYLYSVAATEAPGLFPEGLRGQEGSVPAYSEAARVITVLVLLGQALELGARERPSGAVRARLDLAPRKTLRLRTARIG